MKVFDASAVLALVFGEPGAEVAERLLEEGDGVICSVNHAEVVARLLDRGMSEAEVDTICDSLKMEVAPFTAAQALSCGHLRPATRALGLSLGDRCCLAVAQERPEAEVVTADRPWKALAGFRITLIR